MITRRNLLRSVPALVVGTILTSSTVQKEVSAETNTSLDPNTIKLHEVSIVPSEISTIVKSPYRLHVVKDQYISPRYGHLGTPYFVGCYVRNIKSNVYEHTYYENYIVDKTVSKEEFDGIYQRMIRPNIINTTNELINNDKYNSERAFENFDSNSNVDKFYVDGYINNYDTKTIRVRHIYALANTEGENCMIFSPKNPLISTSFPTYRTKK